MMEEMLKNPYLPLLSLLAGGVLTWLCSRYYYKKSGDELKAESDKLRKATNLIIYCLAHRDAKVTPQYDAEGNVVSLAVDMSAKLEGKGNLSADISDRKRP